jgi:hypothetical protein
MNLPGRQDRPGGSKTEMNDRRNIALKQASGWCFLAIALLALLSRGIMHHRPFEITAAEYRGALMSELPPKPHAMSSPQQPRNSFDSRIAAALTEPDPIQRSMTFGTLFREWVQSDLEGALAWLQTSRRGEARTAGLFIALAYLAQDDPGRAVGLANSLASTEPELQVYNLLFSQIATNDPETAVSLLRSVPAGEAGNNAIGALGGAYATKDFEAALRWARSFSDPVANANAVQAVLIQKIESDPVQAISLAAGELSGTAQNEVVERALRQIQRDDPSAFHEWISEFPNGLPSALVPEAASSLAAYSPDEAMRWLGRIPVGIDHDRALVSMVTAWSRSDDTYASELILKELEGHDREIAEQQLGGKNRSR